MLPGFRSLFVAVTLAISMLIFGLGAAALLRATHEEFASLPLKPMPEVTFGSKEAEQPTLAVLQVDTPAAKPATPESNQADAQHTVTPLSDAQPESGADTPPATDAPSASADTDEPTASPPQSEPVPAIGDTTPPANTAAPELSEPARGSETADEADEAVKPAVAKSDASSTDGKTSGVTETMTSPFGEHSKPPLPASRPVQKTQVADPATPTTKRSSTKPRRAAKKHHHRSVIRQSDRSSQPMLSGSPLELE
jgi:hypothetical protein